MNKLLLALALACLAAIGFSVRAQDVVSPNHTVVRFIVSTAGTNFGSIDLELFDQEKPQTVQNFLGYVYNGVYSNLVLHRAEANFVLQAGHVTLSDPASAALFDSYIPARNYGPITNEYSVGPELSNDYGTIAMARIPGETNSASGDWFINLNHNASLDTVDGGFTVFGRVINTVSDRTGTNLLALLNTTPKVAITSGNPIEPFQNLPVSFARGSTPQHADLFALNAFIVQGPQMPAPNHTIVRMDVFTGGTNFGKIDIELFDQDKPETVRNFLLYVYSGSYSNVLFHALQPNKFLQAGHVQVNDPSGTQTFATFDRTPSFGTSANEYSVGPQLANNFGTIALLPQSTYGESIGSIDWVFNLTNNNSFNTNNGPTVFGRVVNSYGTFAGTNLLHYFNTFKISPGTNVVRGVSLSDAGEAFDLPVTQGFNQRFPVTSELFLMRAAVLESAVTQDFVPPTIQLTQPPESLPETTNATQLFSGTAADNQAVARVIYDFGLSYQRFTAVGKENWSAQVALAAGTNQISVRSVDNFGNSSPAVQRTVVRSQLVPISLEIIGKGTVPGLVNGQLLEAGKLYNVTAKPARGYYFNGWRGDGFSNDRSISFTMTEGLHIVVRFSKTLLGLQTGEYQGVFFPTTNGPANSSGFISLKLGAGGSFSGHLKPIGASYVVHGKLDAAGHSVIGGRLGTNTLVMEVDLASEGSEALLGGYSNGHFFSPFTLWHVQKFGGTNPPPPVGRYTFNLSPPVDTNSGITDGYGFGTVTVDAKGRIVMTGTLADNTIIKKVKAVVLKGNRWPFYFTAKKGDSVLGLPAFTTNGTFSSDVKWFGPAFPGATNQNARLEGSLYSPTAARLFDWENGTITFSGGGLSAPFTSDVVLNDDGSFTVPSNPHNIQVNVNDATGLVLGSFTHPDSNASIAFSGAVLQSSNTAAGFFPGTPRNGGFVIRRAP